MAEWIPLTKSELMEISWIRDSLNKKQTILINDCMCFYISEMKDDGSMVDHTVSKEGPFYILKNIVQPERMRVKTTYYNPDAQSYLELNVNEIKSVQLTTF